MTIPGVILFGRLAILGLMVSSALIGIFAVVLLRDDPNSMALLLLLDASLFVAAYAVRRCMEALTLAFALARQSADYRGEFIVRRLGAR